MYKSYKTFYNIVDILDIFNFFVFLRLHMTFFSFVPIKFIEYVKPVEKSNITIYDYLIFYLFFAHQTLSSSQVEGQYFHMSENNITKMNGICAW